MRKHYKKIRVFVDHETFEKIISGEQTILIREYSHYWERKLIHPRSLQFFPNIVLLISERIGKSRIIYYAHCHNIEIKRVKQKNDIISVFVLYIGPPFDSVLLK